MAQRPLLGIVRIGEKKMTGLRLVPEENNMRFTKLTASLLATCGAMMLAGSALAQDASAGAKIGVSWSYINNIFYTTESRLVVEALKAEGMDPLQITNADGDVAKQIGDIDALLAQGAKALVIVPMDSRAVGPVIERAADQGIPTIGPDIGVDNPRVFINIAVDNELMGKMQCEDLGPKLSDGDKIAYITGNLADLAGKARFDGFNNCMAENFPAVNVVIGESKWDTRVAADALQSILVANPDIKAVALASDSQYLYSSIAVIKAAGRLVPAGEEGHIYVTSIDGSPDAVNAIRAGEADVTIAQPLPQYASLTAKYIKMALNGETVAVGPTDHNSEIVEIDGVLKDVLQPILVNKDNVDSKDVWGNLVD